METRVNYAIVGAFVLVFGLAIIAGVLWISAGGVTRKAYEPYVAYFVESVSGLNNKSPVKYRGVNVGFVEAIELDTDDPNRVRVVLSIEEGVPIRQDTVAILSSQGLTGIAFIDLESDDPSSPPLAQDEEGRPPVIATRPSLFRRLDTQASALVANLSDTSQSVNALLDEQTRASLQRSVRDLEKAIHAFAGRSEAISADVALLLDNAARASSDLTSALERIAKSAEAVALAAEQTRQTGSALQATADEASGGVRQLRGETLPELNALLSEVRSVANSLGRLAQELEHNPNALVLGREPTPPGPGE